MHLDRDDVKGLWYNARNSMYHAFEHFSELAANQGDKDHHQKWIIISVHHVAECFLKILLKELDPTFSFLVLPDLEWVPPRCCGWRPEEQPGNRMVHRVAI